MAYVQTLMFLMKSSSHMEIMKLILLLQIFKSNASQRHEIRECFPLVLFLFICRPTQSTALYAHNAIGDVTQYCLMTLLTYKVMLLFYVYVNKKTAESLVFPLMFLFFLFTSFSYWSCYSLSKEIHYCHRNMYEPHR